MSRTLPDGTTIEYTSEGRIWIRPDTNPLGRKVCRTCMAAARTCYENRKAA